MTEPHGCGSLVDLGLSPAVSLLAAILDITQDSGTANLLSYAIIQEQGMHIYITKQIYHSGFWESWMSPVREL